ncbi:MAG TPA: hypothetical protein PK467_15915, partial [Candidatus Wallbacteria bacterium]|nr:hypothetical protein [Candidatus Wallbacteria bacterium]
EGTLTSLAAGKGYIVKSGAASNAVISVPGAAISTIGNITLKAGFNLVGFSKVPVSMTFKQLMEGYSMIKGIYKWSPAAGSFIQVVRDTNGTIVLLDTTDPTFTAGDSYFFNLTGDTTINYDGNSIVIGASPVDPTVKAAEIAGTINSAAGMDELGLNYQAAAGETFEVTLVDSDGNTVSSIALDANETNPKTVTDGAPYSFKVKDFTKAYKVIARSTTTINKMISVFVGKVKAEEKITNRDVTPISTAISMIYADASKDAAAFKAEEEAKKTDVNFQKRIAPYVSDLESKRQALLKDQVYDTPEKLEKAYKDAVVGSLDPNEIAVIKEGLDAVIGKLEADLTMLEKLKDTLALIATSGQRENETNVKSAQGKLETIITSTNADTANQEVNKDAKIAYGLVCSDLGEIFKNNVNSSTTSAAAGARSLMAAYQVMSEVNTLAEAEFKKGYEMTKNITLTDADNAKGRDKSLAAAILKNASELAISDPAKLDEAKQKADVLISKFESEGTLAVVLPTGEILNKDKILEKKGDALINAGRPSEAVEVFEEVSEGKVKNFGLGRAFLGLNDIENAYKNLKDSVKTVVKSAKGSELRMNEEQNFPKVNEALFAFAAVVDRIKNAPATDTALTAVKQRLTAIEQSASSDSEKILVDTNVTIGGIIKNIKPTTNFFAVGKKLVLDNP